MVYSVEDGRNLIIFLMVSGFVDVLLIGSLGRGEESDNDIDILLPSSIKNEETVNGLIEVLKPEGDIVETDWGGIYFYGTEHGDIDIFFSMEDFDY